MHPSAHPLERPTRNAAMRPFLARMRRPALAMALALSLGLATSLAAAPAFSCFMIMADEEELIPVALPGGKKANLSVRYFQPQFGPRFESAVDGRCEASIALPLSAYPTWRVADGPSAFAARIGEHVRRWRLESCSVTVWLENDTGEEVTFAEGCTTGIFRFDGAGPILQGPEQSCFKDSGLDDVGRQLIELVEN